MSEITLKFIFFGLILSGTIFEVMGDVFFKKWILADKNILLYVGLFAYLIGTVFWAFSLRFESLSKSISIFTVLNLIIIVLVGVFCFRENLSMLNKIGIILGIISVLFLEI